MVHRGNLYEFHHDQRKWGLVSLKLRKRNTSQNRSKHSPICPVDLKNADLIKLPSHAFGGQTSNLFRKQPHGFTRKQYIMSIFIYIIYSIDRHISYIYLLDLYRNQVIAKLFCLRKKSCKTQTIMRSWKCQEQVGVLPESSETRLSRSLMFFAMSWYRWHMWAPFTTKMHLLILGCLKAVDIPIQWHMPWWASLSVFLPEKTSTHSSVLRKPVACPNKM